MSETRKISDIIIPERHRKNLGDIDSLKKSIEDVGLLQPLVIRPDNVLVAGERRLSALRGLGKEEAPVHVVTNLEEAVRYLRAERDENICREPLPPSRAVAQADQILEMEKPVAKERELSGKSADGAGGGRGRKKNPTTKNRRVSSARDSNLAETKAAEGAGMSRSQYRKAREVTKAAEADPELFGPIQNQMDETGNVNAALKAKRKVEEDEELKRAAALVVEEQPDVRQCSMQQLLAALSGLDAIVTDPPYPEEFLPLYGELARLAASALAPTGVLAVMCGQSYLPRIIALMTPHLPYRWTAAYLTPGGQSVQLWDRKVNTFWKPILIFGAAGDWTGDVVKSNVNDNDKRFHHWGQSESGMKALVEALTRPGQTVCDPFAGAGTTGVACVASGRHFVGCDIDAAAVERARARIILQASQMKESSRDCADAQAV